MLRCIRLLALTTLAASLLAPASASAAVKAAEVRGTTSVAVGYGGGHTLLRIPHTATLTLSPTLQEREAGRGPSDFAISAKSTATTVFLTPHTGKDTGELLFAGSWALCRHAGCSASAGRAWFGIHFTETSGEIDHVTLKPGLWDLYLVTDAPATVTMRFGGLSGRVTLDRLQRTPTSTWTPDGTSTVLPAPLHGGTDHLAGSHHDATARRMLMLSTNWLAADNAQMHYNYCSAPGTLPQSHTTPEPVDCLQAGATSKAFDTSGGSMSGDCVPGCEITGTGGFLIGTFVLTVLDHVDPAGLLTQGQVALAGTYEGFSSVLQVVAL